MTTTDQQFDPLSVPVIRQVAEADIPGFLAAREDLQRPELAPVAARYKDLPKFGLSLYGARDGRFAVFNAEVFKPEEIQQFDAQGQLESVLPPITTLLGGGAGKPAAGSAGPSGVAAAAPQPVAASPAPAAGAPQPAPQGPQVRARARVSALDALAAPTQKPAPGSGSVLQGLGRPVV